MDPSLSSLLLLGAPLGLLAGAWAGLCGFSAWLLVVPVLLVFGELPVHVCLAASLIVDLVNAACATPIYLGSGHVDTRIARRLALLALPLALAGAATSFAVLEHFEDLIREAAGFVSIGLGSLLLWRTRSMNSNGPQDSYSNEASTTGAPPPPDGSEPGWDGLYGPPGRRRFIRGGVAVTSLLMGLIAVASGFNVAFLLITGLDVSTRRGVGTALLFTCLALPVVLVAYLAFLGFQLPVIAPLAPFVAFSALGSWAAARYSRRIPERALGYTVSGCVVAAGILASIRSAL